VLTISNDEKLTLENQYVANMFYSRLVILKPHLGRMRQAGVTNNQHLRCIAALNHAAYCLFDAVAQIKNRSAKIHLLKPEPLSFWRGDARAAGAD
jgi:hypothetical protein